MSIKKYEVLPVHFDKSGIIFGPMATKKGVHGLGVFETVGSGISIKPLGVYDFKRDPGKELEFRRDFDSCEPEQINAILGKYNEFVCNLSADDTLNDRLKVLLRDIDHQARQYDSVDYGLPDGGNCDSVFSELIKNFILNNSEVVLEFIADNDPNNRPGM